MADAENGATPANGTEVYAIHGADPEVLAYAMAKYSRSALTLRESLAEISSQRAEQFLNTFYFQYGHRSIADLAHVAFAVERLSLLAAIALVDEPRWDGQERSTRYQNFRKSGYYTPQFDTPEQTAEYTALMNALFDGYTAVGEGMLGELKAHTPKPASMDEAAYTRTLRARAYDMARYLLPLGTNTSLGQITNARTLEGQISRLLGSDYAEIRDLGEKLREAAAGPAWNVQHRAGEQLVGEVRDLHPELAARAGEHLLREVRTSPTLVKYTAPSDYQRESRAALQQAAMELMGDAAIQPMPADSPNVDLVLPSPGEQRSLEIDLATSLLYPHTHFRFRQLREAIAALDEHRLDELVELGTRHRGKHDELLRAFSAANGLRFDILMDVGGFRDMHRHRRCTQLLQDYTTEHGYDLPDFPGQPQLSGSPVQALYTGLLQRAYAFHGAQSHDKESSADACAADYVLPLATRCRSLFTMDFAQAVYMSELRSTPAGHWSYRTVAWQMYRAVAHAFPALARHFRISDPCEVIDLLQR